MVAPQPPVCRSTRLGTFPAAILRPRGWPFSAVPFRNCALVQTDATVVNSLITTFAGGVLPSTDSHVTPGCPCRPRPPRSGTGSHRRHCSPGCRVGTAVTTCPAPSASCLGSPLLAAHSVTVDWRTAYHPPGLSLECELPAFAAPQVPASKRSGHQCGGLMLSLDPQHLHFPVYRPSILEDEGDLSAQLPCAGAVGRSAL